MIKNQVEKNKVGSHTYERYEVHSNVLNQDLHCGFLRQSPPAQITKTIYLFHGGGADDTQAAQAGLLPVLADLFSAHPEVQVVLPNIGSHFLHDHPTHTEKSYSKYFLEEILPACENGTQTKAGSRYLSGWSMGGQAALNMFLRQPAQFAGVGVHFPTLVEFDYNDAQQAAGYAARQNVAEGFMKVLVEEFKKTFIDSKDFNNHNPLHLAKNLPKAALENKKIYFDVGLKDEFGLSEGAKALHQILENKGIPHHYSAVAEGKHDGPFIHGQIAKLMKALV